MYSRPVVIAIGAALAVMLTCGLVLYFVWELEESQKPIRTVVIENPEGDAIFSVEMRDQDEGPDVIVYCSEEDFQDAFTHFTQFVNIDTEPLKAPGGPMLLALADLDVPDKLKPAQRALVELLKRHSPRRVVLVAHTDCLLYDTIAAWRDNLDEVKQRQHQDLIAARNTIKRWFPETEVEIYLADKQGDRLKFFPMSERIPASEELGDSIPLDGADEGARE